MGNCRSRATKEQPTVRTNATPANHSGVDEEHGLITIVPSPRVGGFEHNTSITTPMVHSVFAYPDSPQLMGPRHAEDNFSSRQPTGSLAPATPASPPLSCCAGKTRLQVANTTGVYPHITSYLLGQLQESDAAHMSPPHSRPHSRGSSTKGHDDTEDAPLTKPSADDSSFVAARRYASIQNVLSWMDTGSSSGMTREDSELIRNHSVATAEYCH